MIGTGAYSPLDGFLSKGDYESVIREGRLSNGTVWTIPIVLPVSGEKVKELKGRDQVILTSEGRMAALIFVEEIYDAKKDEEALGVFGTRDTSHPGVRYLYSRGDYLLGGKISYLKPGGEREFQNHRHTPGETRRVFSERGWERVVGFQTRNPIHRAHEYLLKSALELSDGLFLSPLIGETKAGDVPASLRMKCYETLIENYFPKNRVFLSVIDTSMRYAGPKEAIFHALIRKNYGCTHFIVGRDHAGVGKFYAPFDAQKIFSTYRPDELGIKPLFFNSAFYCIKCEQMASEKTCPHPASLHLDLSGTAVREMLDSGELPPREFTRSEVADILLGAYLAERG